VTPACVAEIRTEVIEVPSTPSIPKLHKKTRFNVILLVSQPAKKKRVVSESWSTSNLFARCIEGDNAAAGDIATKDNAIATDDDGLKRRTTLSRTLLNRTTATADAIVAVHGDRPADIVTGALLVVSKLGNSSTTAEETEKAVLQSPYLKFTIRKLLQEKIKDLEQDDKYVLRCLVADFRAKLSRRSAEIHSQTMNTDMDPCGTKRVAFQADLGPFFGKQGLNRAPTAYMKAKVKKQITTEGASPYFVGPMVQGSSFDPPDGTPLRVDDRSAVKKGGTWCYVSRSVEYVTRTMLTRCQEHPFLSKAFTFFGEHDTVVFGLAVDAAPENNQCGFADCSLTCWNLMNYSCSPYYSSLVFLCSCRGPMGDSHPVLLDRVHIVGQEIKRLTKEPNSFVHPISKVPLSLRYVLVGDMKGKAPIKGCSSCTAEYGDPNVGGLTNALFERVMARGSKSQAIVGTYDQWKQQQCDIYLFDYKLRKRLFNELQEYLASPDTIARIAKYMARAQPAQTRALLMRMSPAERDEYNEKKRVSFIQKQLALPFCQQRGHTQLKRPLIKDCDEDTPDALHCKLNTAGMDLVHLLFYFCVTCTNVLHYEHVAVDPRTAYQFYLKHFESALGSAPLYFSNLASLIFGVYEGDREAVAKWERKRLIGEHCNKLLLHYASIVEKIPYPPESHPKLRLWWRVLYCYGLYLTTFIRELSRVSSTEYQVTDSPGLLSSEFEGLEDYYDNLCDLVCKVRFIYMYWLPPSYSDRPQIRYIT
jgi:hypothetical protein